MVNPWFHYSMKTAISVPDDVFALADALARRLKISRSELYATAVAEYVAKQRDEGTTEKLNVVYADLPGGVDPALRGAQGRSGWAEW